MTAEQMFENGQRVYWGENERILTGTYHGNDHEIGMSQVMIRSCFFVEDQNLNIQILRIPTINLRSRPIEVNGT